MSKQTAVEWLYELSKERELDKFDLEQAKAMHKDEIMDARRNGSYKVTEKYGEIRTNIQYYNETFGGNK